MLKRITKEKVPAVLEYLGKDVENCIYLYIDISVYGVDNPNMKVWVDESDEGIRLVAMQYHNGFQVYADSNDFDAVEVADLFMNSDAGMLSARESIINILIPLVSDGCSVTYGSILRLTKIHSFGCEKAGIEQAGPEDVDEIAGLICGDDYYLGSYDFKHFREELADRMRTGMGRSFIIRDNGRIVAHNSITAEAGDIAVAGMLVVRRDYRHTLYALHMEEFIIKKLNDEGKKLFGFSTDKKRGKQFELMGNKVAAKYGKIIKA
jgi:predicted GNAT family acetyltransferase